jgi:hypothetical protein
MNRAAELGLYVEEFASPYVEGEGKSRVVGLPDKSRTRPPLVRLAFIRYWDRHSFGASQKSEIKTSASHHMMGLSPKLEGRVRGLFSASQRPAASTYLLFKILTYSCWEP